VAGFVAMTVLFLQAGGGTAIGQAPSEARPIESAEFGSPAAVEAEGRIVFRPPASWGQYEAIFYGDRRADGEDASDEPALVLPDAGRPTDVKSRQELRELFGDRLDVLNDQVDRLGSAGFADRERATTELLEAGFEIVPILHHAASGTSDAEVRLRIDQLLVRLEDQYRQSIEAAFLAGTAADLPGWDVARRLLGDSDWIRREYVQMHREVPELLAALDGDTLRRTQTLERVLNTPNPEFMGAMGPDSRAALAAILMVAADPDYEPDVGVESHLLNHLRRSQGQQLLRGGVSREYGTKLFGDFLMKTSPTYRSQWLFHGSDRDLPATRLLAARTLSESDSPDELTSAMAAAVRFAASDQIELIADHLDDDRGMGANRMREGVLVDIRVSDVAMAAIGSLLGKRTDEIGFTDDANYPNVGLHLDRLALPVVPDAKTSQRRRTIRENVDALLRVHRLNRRKAARDEPSADAEVPAAEVPAP